MKNILALLLCFVSFQIHALSLDLSNGESSDVEVYSGGDKAFEIIYMHGKNSKPVIFPAERLFEELSDAGYTVYSAEMPWSREKYRGTQETANEIITQLTNKINAKGKQAILIGHSMGASYAVIYAAQSGKKIAGIIPIAFAHVPQMNERFQGETAESIIKANQMVASGKGKETDYFQDLNMGKSYDIDATAEYYKSFYDPETLPDASEVIKTITAPILWISAQRDRLTEIYMHDDIFETAPKNEKSTQIYVKGNHVAVLKFSSESIINWLKKL